VERLLAATCVLLFGSLVGAAGPGDRAEARADQPAVSTGHPAQPKPAKPPLMFDSSRAFEHIRQLVSIGPRPPGSAGIAAARTYIADQIKAMGLTAVEQPFLADTPLGPIRMVNVIVTIPGASRERIVIGGHYDTKLYREFRFVGANDGGSSTAMLIELARSLKSRRGPYTIDLVFFDGEEALVEWVGTDHTYGSRHYVEQARKDGTLKLIRAMVLVDMVGDRDLELRRETNSTPWLTDIVWAAAGRLGYGRYFVDDEQFVEDDHIPFLRAGVPAVNIIDMQYEPWHTAGDTLDKVSARSLQIVGDVVLEALPRIEQQLKKGPPKGPVTPAR
jgi:glutaminyl-peptide cyclotransferase